MESFLYRIMESFFLNNNNNNNQRKQITRGRYNTKLFLFLAHTPAGAESDLNAAAAAPSQTEVTDLNCSDHSTTSKEMARGELW